MLSVINTNNASIVARNALRLNNREMSSAMEQLSTGKRINSAVDDAAGLSISEGMTAQIRGLGMAMRNANDGISVAQTMEGAAGQITNMLHRMRELAVQSTSQTFSTDQRTYIDKEYQALKTQIKRTIAETNWNTLPVLGSTADITFKIQTGADESSGADDQYVNVVAKTIVDTNSLSATSMVTTDIKASAAIGEVDADIVAMNALRADLGSVVSRLSSVTDNIANRVQNLSESRSRITDADYAQVTAELTRTQIIQQAGMAVLAQANQQPQAVLSLLK